MPPATAPSIQAPRMSFEESLQEVTRYLDRYGDLLSNHIAACQSAVLPDGEESFDAGGALNDRMAGVA